MKYNVVVVILFVVNEVFAGSVAWGGTKESADASEFEKKSICNDIKAINDNLSVQYFNEKEESEDDLLGLLGVRILDDPDVRRGIRFVGATRISGSCANHVDDVDFSNYHLDTGIYLRRNKEGFFVPQEKDYKKRPFVGKNDMHPDKANQIFIKAIKVGFRFDDISDATEFIGIWEEDGKSILTPYKKMPSGDFHVYNDIIEVDREIIFISFLPGPDGPFGAIMILLQGVDDRVSMSFSWTFPGLFYEMN